MKHMERAITGQSVQYLLQLDLAEQGPLICKCASAV